MAIPYTQTENSVPLVGQVHSRLVPPPIAAGRFCRQIEENPGLNMAGELNRKALSRGTFILTLVLTAFLAVGCGGPGGDPPKSTSSGPAIASVSPNIGPPNGGTNVTITGTGFDSSANVFFGGTAATNVIVVSGGQITCTTPPNPPGPVTVTVQMRGRGGSASLSNGFMYDGLSLTSVSPVTGNVTGGTAVTLRGTQFQTTTNVTFGGVAATSKVFISSTEMTAVTPPHAAGAVTVQVSNTDGQTASLSNAFTYEQVTVTSLSVTSGPSTGGTSVTITGKLFQPGATVRFGGTAASVTYKSSTELQVVTPAHTSGIVDVEVRNPDNQSDALEGGFTYSDVLRVTSVTPANGPPTGGTSVTLVGANFQAGAVVRFGANAATSVNVLSSTQISCVTPSGSGAVDVTVVNPSNETATLAGGFTFDPPKTINTAPVISEISPNSGGISGGTSVLISGTNFQSGATVTFGGIAATQVSIQANQIAAATPAHNSGIVDVKVTNPDGQFDTATGAFTYVGLTITDVTPNVGSTVGGTLVTITGSEFNSGTTVFFGGVQGTGVVILSSAQLQVTAPAHVSGVVDIEVRNTNGQNAFLVGGFTYEPPPTITALSREVGSAAGGTRLTITGTGFFSGIKVFFGGVQAPSVTVLSSTQMQVVTPAHAPGLVEVLLRNVDGSEFRKLNGFDYRPAPTTIWVGHNFEDGTLGRFRGAFSTDALQPTSSSEAAAVGGRSAKMGGVGFASRLEYRWCRDLAPNLSGSQPCNPALVEPNGLYQRFYMMLPQSTIDAVVATEQMKLLLNRANVDAGGSSGAWVVIIFGLEGGSFPRNELRTFEDSGFDSGTNKATNFLLQGGVWYEFQTYYKKDPSTCRGTYFLWANGKLIYKLENLLGLGSCDTTKQQALWVGQVVLEAPGFSGLVYVDDVVVANGYIEP